MFVFIYIDFLYVDVYLYVHLYLYMYVCICFYCCKCMHVSTYDTKRLSALKPCKLHLYPPSIHFVYLIMIPFFLFPNSERDKKQNSPLSRKEGRHVKKKQQSVSQFRRFDSSEKQQQQSAAISSAGWSNYCSFPWRTAVLIPPESCRGHDVEEGRSRRGSKLLSIYCCYFFVTKMISRCI